MKRKVRIVKAPTLCQLFSKLRRQPGERFRVVLTNDTTDPSSGKRLDEVVQVELDRIEAPTENRPTFLLRGRGYRPGTASAHQVPYLIDLQYMPKLPSQRHTGVAVLS